VSAFNALFWATIGLLLTIVGTFVEVFSLNPPWEWGEGQIQLHSLGITYQIAAVLLAGCLGGKSAGAVSQIAYVIIGLYWFPVFAQGGGLDYIHQPSFGYLLGFIPGAWLTGFIAFRSSYTVENYALGALCGLAAIHVIGLVYLLFFYFGNWQTLLAFINQYCLNPLPGQLACVCLVSLISFVFRKILLY